MSVISSTKLIVLRALSRINIFRCRFKGMKIGRQCSLYGMPFVKRVPGSEIILGNDVTLTSRRQNPLLEHPVSLRTLTSTARIHLADHVGISGSRLVCCNEISIGEYTIIGPNTLLYDSEGHDYNPVTGWKNRVCYTGRPIHIGSKCFIGTGCIIMSGVTIGDNCVVSAGTVLKEDLPAGHKAEGNPARISPLPRALGGAGHDHSPRHHQNEPLSSIPELREDEEMLAMLEKIRNFLELDFELKADDEFRSYAEWDSLAFLSLVALLKDEYHCDLTPSSYNQLQSWKDVYLWLREQKHTD